MSQCVHCLVSGRVQGVFYRSSAYERAINLGLTGWIRNLADGRVEVVACGNTDRLQQFQDWLRQGPAHAQVSEVECRPTRGDDVGERFEVRG